MTLEIRETGIYGKWVFAGEAIRVGSIIGILDGVLLDLDECVAKVQSGEEEVSDPLQVGLELWLDLDEWSRTFNHSCNPTAGLRKRSELFALRDIAADEEITYDYSLTVAPNVTADLWTMPCTCSNSECRKIIGNILSIPEARLVDYTEQGALQDYMKAELKRIGKENGMYILPEYRKIVL